MKLRTRGIRKAALGISAGVLALASALFQTTAAQAAGGWENMTQPLPYGWKADDAQVLALGPDSVVLMETEETCPIGCEVSSHLWDRTGGSWVPKPPTPSDIYKFEAIAGTATDDVWTFGGPDFGYPSAYHWNGTAWTRRGFTGPFFPHAGVATARGQLMAAGTQTVSGYSRPAVQRWTGTAWSPVTVLPAPAGKNVSVDAIHQAAPNDIWVVGETTVSSGTTEMYVARFNGTTWTQVAAPKLTAGFDYLRNQVAGTSTDLWITGKKSADGCHTSLRFNGTVWSTLPTCGGLAVTTVVKYRGEWIGGGDASFGLRKWTGAAWTPLTAPAAGATVRRLTAEPGDGALWATGSDANGIFASRLPGAVS
ncbi:hypothetical protein ACIQUQ_17540 [Streptomyces sp. NPDC101118]|uniref:hypothetical protein n=1 Tax=Streptomyces sp. NPDC101118 TaxID=3366109 RepID=UPI00381E1788